MIHSYTIKRLLYYAVNWNMLSIKCCKTNFHKLGTAKKIDFSYMYICYNILETYCANAPLIYSSSCYLCLFNKYLFLSHDDRVFSSGGRVGLWVPPIGAQRNKLAADASKQRFFAAQEKWFVKPTIHISLVG